MDEVIKSFGEDILRKAARAAMQLADQMPVPTHVVVLTRGDDIVGGRVHFSAPTKAVWVQAPSAECENGKIEVGASEYERKKQGNLLEDTYHFFEVTERYSLHPIIILTP